MALIPKKDQLKELLDHQLVLQDFRPYIGMSALKGKCMRSIWYNFRWACDRYVPKRIQRIFERGDLEEARVVKDLRAEGMLVSDCLEFQIELVDETGHIRGHPDGKVDKVPVAPKTTHCLEVKTMKDSLFKAYVKKGLELSNPAYWGQVHTYMGEQGITRALFIVTNKDTEERHYERIEYDKDVHDECMSIGLNVLLAEFPPKKIGQVTWYECKMCDNKNICHKGAKIKQTCRSCKHVNIEMEGKWSCGNPDWHSIAGEINYVGYSNVLNVDHQMASCSQYEIDEAFLC